MESLADPFALVLLHTCSLWVVGDFIPRDFPGLKKVLGGVPILSLVPTFKKRVVRRQTQAWL